MTSERNTRRVSVCGRERERERERDVEGEDVKDNDL